MNHHTPSAGPTRVDSLSGEEGHNQNPPHLAPELTTKADMNSVSNLKNREDANKAGVNSLGNSTSPSDDLGINTSRGANPSSDAVDAESEQRKEQQQQQQQPSTTPVTTQRREHDAGLIDPVDKKQPWSASVVASALSRKFNGSGTPKNGKVDLAVGQGSGGSSAGGAPTPPRDFFTKAGGILRKYSKFVGPGFMISVSYMDPGNYSTDVAAGAQFRFSHLFVILLSNLFAIFLQGLCVKLGTVTGLDLAQNCKKNLPKWLNYILYFLSQCAIIATDIAEVIGSAIALNILLKIPLIAGVAITTVDVLVVLFFYKPNGPMRNLRFFELFVALLVFGVIICFCIELSNIKNIEAGEVMKGYLPSKAVASGEGLYLSCGILGATVMPHSLFLGTGIVQARVKDVDIQNGTYVPPENVEEDDSSVEKYKPSVTAIKSTMNYCLADMAISLFTCALFANSAILIVSGATLSNTPEAGDADLFSIHSLLSKNLSKAAGTLFALALLFSGESAGVVVTLAGQMVSMGFLSWKIKPWKQRLVTRVIAISPSVVVAAIVGRRGLADVLNASQVALSILLPFVSAPLVYFTCRSQYMRVVDNRRQSPNSDVSLMSAAPEADESQDDSVTRGVDMSNGWLVSGIAICIWTFIAGLNGYLIVTLAMGKN